MNIVHLLTKALAEALSTLELSTRNIKLTPPNNPDFGDLSSNLALILAKEAHKNPLQLAEEIKGTLALPKDIINEISVTPPGFINFKISPSYYYSALKSILESKEYGRRHSGKGKTANVEFVSANPTGPLTVGHGRQAVLGDTVSNILEWNGYNVTREYYYNDAGRQMRILGKSVEARYFEQLGLKAIFPEDGYQGEYIKDISNEIREIHGENLKIDDPIFRKAAEDHIFSDIKNSLNKLGIHHDKFSNEKTFYDSGDIEKTIKDLSEKNLVYDSQGATWFKTTSLGIEKDRVLIKSSGEPTYRLPDIAYHRNKVERNFDLIVDIFGADHADTYPDVLAALDALNYTTHHIRVLIHQFVTLIKGGEKVKMSTRKADFVTLEELTDEVGPDVVRYFFIMRGMNSHLNFDLDLAADQSEKNPVYYLQYAHARICNIIKHGESMGQSSTQDYNAKLLTHPQELRLLKKLEQFPELVESCLASLEPQTMANYLQETATCFHKFYAECRVVTDDKTLSKARLALITATSTVIGNGLRLLGLSAPERM